jgi:hypothetical protein
MKMKLLQNASQAALTVAGAFSDSALKIESEVDTIQT